METKQNFGRMDGLIKPLSRIFSQICSSFVRILIGQSRDGIYPMLTDWEIERVAALLGTLGGISITTTATDRVLWKLSTDGVFSVKSAYNSGLHEMTSGTQYPWRYYFMK